MLHSRKTREMDCKSTTKNSYTQIFSKENTFFRVFSSFCYLYLASFFFSGSSNEPLFYRLPLLVLSLDYAYASPFFFGSGHRRFSPSPALHPQYPPLRQFLSCSARTITSSSRPSHRLLSRMLFGNIRCAAPPARSQCGCSLGCLPSVMFPVWLISGPFRPLSRHLMPVSMSIPPDAIGHKKAATSLPPRVLSSSISGGLYPPLLVRSLDYA